MDEEGGKPASAIPQRIKHFRQILDVAGITPEIQNWPYDGSGTEEDPYVVVWIEDDPRNPQLYSQTQKWCLTAIVAMAALAAAFVSSAYSGGSEEIIAEFGCSQEIFTLGISLCVLGFAVGPLIWAPLSELFGRQVIFIGTYFALSAFNAGAAGSQNIYTLVILRFFAGAFGSSPLTNSGGVIADMFMARERGLAMTLFAAAPFMGPVLGPIVGGFVGETVGWRWVEGVMAIFTGVIWIIGCFCLPETYPPVILRRRARKLSKMTGKVYKTKAEIQQGQISPAEVFKTSLSRPLVLLFREPIVFLLSLYMAIIYGTLYMLFGAFPIVYQEIRGWSAGIGGLAFLGVCVGMLIAVGYAVWDNKRFARVVDNHDGFAPPEARLPVCMIGSVAVPIGLFWFAWTNYPSIHWIVSIMAGAPFGFGMVLVFLGVMNYLIDAYTIFAASVLAANTVLRSLFGAAFPLFTTYMYQNLGIHWASTIPAFLALICLPFPFLGYKYGYRIRIKCKYAAESEKFMREMQNTVQEPEYEKSTAPSEEEDSFDEDKRSIDEEPPSYPREEVEEPVHDDDRDSDDGQFAPIRPLPSNTNALHMRAPTPRRTSAVSNRSGRSQRSLGYEGNPFDLDRINTRDSFKRRSSQSNPRRGSIASSIGRRESIASSWIGRRWSIRS